LTKYEDKLKSLPVPDVARKYYMEDNPYMFDKFCTVKSRECKVDDADECDRRPVLNNLYDVFVNVRDDEREHWKTLCNLVQYDDMQATYSEDVRPTGISRST
jgi:ubiquinol oxidase